MRIQNLLPFGAIIASSALLACGSNSGSSGPGGVGGNNVGGSTGTHTTSNTNAGNPSVGGNSQTGGTSSNNTAAGGNTGAGGTSASQSTTANNTSAGGKTGVGGTSSGNTGGKTGTSTSATGGKSTTGGTNSGNTGGKSTTGGTNSGNTGGKATTGGTSSGNTGVGGGAMGGDTSVSATGGSSGTGDRLKGYWMLSDWSVSSPDWHGCAWTGVDKVANTTTKVTPSDFLAASPSDPYHVTGTVNKSYEAVALLGFNIGEAAGTDPNQCKYDPTKTTEDGPPAATMTSIVTSKKGLAINWTAKTKPGMFRVQLQEPTCASDLGKCYCATITDSTGPSFVKWSDFAAYCWNADGSDTAHPLPVKYTNSGIDAVVFSAPGNGTADTAFDFTVNGFAPGDSAADAPGKAPTCGQMIGTIGSTTASEAASMQRIGVTDASCNAYVVQNNNWGNKTGSTQTLDYGDGTNGNTFTVKTSTGNGGGNGVPASFPSIYVGANGDLGGGSYDTWAKTGLPKKISAITSANTTFTWSGGTGSKNFNASYDVWFASSSPTAGGYNDGVSGFIMVWFYKPGNNNPIGQSSNTRSATINGKQFTVWRGPRNDSATGTDGPKRPVISYVANSTLNDWTFNLKDFISDAVANASADAGGVNQGNMTQFSGEWYLTDVFAGFEAWTGGDIVGAKAKMSIVIQ